MRCSRFEDWLLHMPWEQFRNKTPLHPNHVKHAEIGSTIHGTGGRYDTEYSVQWRLIMARNSFLCRAYRLDLDLNLAKCDKKKLGKSTF